MKKNVLKNDALLLLTSLIWGFAFVAQRMGMNFIGPYTFNGVRFLLGPLSLLPLIFYRWKIIPREHKRVKPYLLTGLAAGLILFTASTLQQIGIVYTTAGNAGFITGFYVVLVPILGFFFKTAGGTYTLDSRPSGTGRSLFPFRFPGYHHWQRRFACTMQCAFLGTSYYCGGLCFSPD
jgi:drug/metabolite transporter (DMT)-like permease